MTRLPPKISLCVISLVLASCQSISMPDVSGSLSALDFDLDSSSYVVRAGETLETIAYRYDTSVSALNQLNPSAAQGVYAGMRLNVRQPVSGTQQASSAAPLPEVDNPRTTDSALTAPAPTRQAVPIPTIASNLNSRSLPRRERYNRNPAQVPAIVARAPETYTERQGFPVEEVIDDENFVLPTTTTGVSSDLPEYVGGWQWPLNGKLARKYDVQRPNGRGIEIVGLPGQEVFASRDGVVDWVARSPDGVGKVVIVRHDDDYLSIYSNAQDLFVSMKDSVKQGDPIASLGANANDEPLLRFEISKGGNLLNPIDFLTPR